MSAIKARVKRLLTAPVRMWRSRSALLDAVLPYTGPLAPVKRCLLAIYDFRVAPYTFNFVEFLANAEVFRVQNCLSLIDLVFVVDREKRHRGDQPEVTQANFRNWILNLAECTDFLPSIGSICLFDDHQKFMSLYQRSRRTHMIFPVNGFLYRPKAKYCLADVSAYFRQTGYAPKFQSSGVLLDWAEQYLLQNSYPLLPIVFFVRNSTTYPRRNTRWLACLDFIRGIAIKYPVKFFLINDFWNPVDVPPDLHATVRVCAEATISVKYRAALAQRAAVAMGPLGGCASPLLFSDTPYLLFGADGEDVSGNLNIQMHGMTQDLQFPWATKYQRVLPVHGDADYMRGTFEALYDLLERDQKLIPDYFGLLQGTLSR